MRAVLFDLDGTLVNTIDLYERAVIGSLATIGIDYPSDRFVADYMAGRHLRDILAEFGLTEEHAPSVRGARDRLYEELLGQAVEWSPGAEELLKKTAERYPLGIVTGSWRSYVDRIERKLALSRYTNIIVTADDMGMGKFQKPHPHGLLLAADRLGAAPEECVYIGDQLFDIEAAKRAGMRSVLVIGKHTPAGGQEEADEVARSLEEVLRYCS
ncbi:MAG: phosphoglycolate phosphatase [Candidatus Peregrinibacteria bacterium Greene0416_19]|nr:MAG: phosphoglycolate phosphatase [Candidatus Peregrinibacteria bacterium Greene0416_19]